MDEQVGATKPWIFVYNGDTFTDIPIPLKQKFCSWNEIMSLNVNGMGFYGSTGEDCHYLINQ